MMPRHVADITIGTRYGRCKADFHQAIGRDNDALKSFSGKFRRAIAGDIKAFPGEQSQWRKGVQLRILILKDELRLLPDTEDGFCRLELAFSYDDCDGVLVRRLRAGGL